MEVIAAISGKKIESSGIIRALMDSFKVEVVLQNNSIRDPNAVMSCFMALNLLPRLLKCVRYTGDTGILSLFPPSHSAKINLGRNDDWKPDFTLVFGREKVNTENAMYVSSAGWSIYLSKEHPCKWVQATDIPAKDNVGAESVGVINNIAAMHAGALAVGEVFKQLMRSYITANSVTTTFEYDLVTHGKAPQPVITPAIPEMVHFNLVIVGTGAIGQALIVSLASATSISGHVILMDRDKLEPSNEQRYLLGYDEHRGKPKVNVMQEVLKQGHPALSLTIAPMSYEDTVSALEGLSFQPEIIVAAVDNAKTRVNIQAALPKVAWNVWTDVSEGNLRYGIGRHTLDNPYECMACSYFPKVEDSPTQLEMNSMKTGIPQGELADRIAKGDVCKPEDISRIAATNNILRDGLQGFLGMPLKEVLHGNCGLFNVSLPGKQETAPAPHTPVLAGTLLASQLILSQLKLPPDAFVVESVAEFDCFRLPNISCLMKKRRNPKCFCNEPTYAEAYQTKWKG
jgi:molybdopterin/thiamine biosynthesis adenylyltransferase